MLTPPNSQSTSRQPRPTPGGFPRIGLAVSLFVLSVLTTVAVPLIQQQVRAARAAETAHQLQTFARTFAAAAKTTGDWPSAPAAPGKPPPGPGFEALAADWRRPSPIGGQYQWVAHSPQAGARIRAGITIAPTAASAVSTDRTLLVAIDAALDDGDLATGRFRLGYRAQPLLILEP